MKWSLKYFYEETPLKVRKIADKVYGACGTVLAASIIGNYRTLGCITLILLGVSYVFSNSYTEKQ